MKTQQRGAFTLFELLVILAFLAILFAMLYWAGTKPSLLVLLGSPVIGLVLAFSTVAWGAWIIVLLALLLWWRPYVWEGLAVMLANVLMWVVAVPFWRKPCYRAVSTLPPSEPHFCKAQCRGPTTYCWPHMLIIFLIGWSACLLSQARMDLRARR